MNIKLTADTASQIKAGMEINLTQADEADLLRAGIRSLIAKAIADTFIGYNNPISTLVEAYVGEVADGLIRTQFAAQIKAAVVAELTAKYTSEIVARIAKDAVEKAAKEPLKT